VTSANLATVNAHMATLSADAKNSVANIFEHSIDLMIDLQARDEAHISLEEFLSAGVNVVNVHNVNSVREGLKAYFNFSGDYQISRSDFYSIVDVANNSALTAEIFLNHELGAMIKPFMDDGYVYYFLDANFDGLIDDSDRIQMSNLLNNYFSNDIDGGVGQLVNDSSRYYNPSLSQYTVFIPTLQNYINFENSSVGYIRDNVVDFVTADFWSASSPSDHNYYVFDADLGSVISAAGNNLLYSLLISTPNTNVTNSLLKISLYSENSVIAPDVLDFDIIGFYDLVDHNNINNILLDLLNYSSNERDSYFEIKNILYGLI